MSKLPPLKDLKAFDGYKEDAVIPRDTPLLKKCNHKSAKLVSSIELKCPCGVGYHGFNVQALYEAIQSS